VFAHQDSSQEIENPSIECVGFSNEAFKWLATGGMDSKLCVWELTTGSRRLTCEHDDGVVALKWHSSLPVLCSSSLDCSIKIWDGRNGSCLATLTGHSNFVTNFSIICDQENEGKVISVSDDHTVKVFRANFNLVI
jgi:WD40 repeat protein